MNRISLTNEFKMTTAAMGSKTSPTNEFKMDIPVMRLKILLTKDLPEP